MLVYKSLTSDKWTKGGESQRNCLGLALKYARDIAGGL